MERFFINKFLFLLCIMSFNTFFFPQIVHADSMDYRDEAELRYLNIQLEEKSLPFEAIRELYTSFKFDKENNVIIFDYMYRHSTNGFILLKNTYSLDKEKFIEIKYFHENEEHILDEKDLDNLDAIEDEAVKNIILHINSIYRFYQE